VQVHYDAIRTTEQANGILANETYFRDWFKEKLVIYDFPPYDQGLRPYGWVHIEPEVPEDEFDLQGMETEVPTIVLSLRVPL
jgi:hypothetical protein